MFALFVFFYHLYLRTRFAIFKTRKAMYWNARRGLPKLIARYHAFAVRADEWQELFFFILLGEAYYKLNHRKPSEGFGPFIEAGCGWERCAYLLISGLYIAQVVADSGDCYYEIRCQSAWNKEGFCLLAATDTKLYGSKGLAFYQHFMQGVAMQIQAQDMINQMGMLKRYETGMTGSFAVRDLGWWLWCIRHEIGIAWLKIQPKPKVVEIRFATREEELDFVRFMNEPPEQIPQEYLPDPN